MTPQLLRPVYAKVAALCVMCARVCTADDRLADYYVAGLENGRSQLHTGSFHAHGIALEKDPKSGERKSDIVIYSAFDFPMGKLRFDLREPRRELMANGSTKTSVAQYRIVKTREKSLVWSSISPGTVQVLKPHEFLRVNAKPFDVRTLGCAPPHSLSIGSDLDAVIADLKATPPTEIAKEGQSIVKLVWLVGDESRTRRTLWIDEAHGFSPIRLEFSYLTGTTAAQQRFVPMSVAEATWSQQSGVWVPKTFSQTTGLSGRTGRSLHLSFDWEAVNKAIPAELFDYKGLELPLGTSVVDKRLDTPILVDRIGGVPSRERRTDRRSTQLVIGIGGLTCVLIGGLVVAWRRRQAA